MVIHQIGRWLLVNGTDLAILIASICATVVSLGTFAYNLRVQKMLKQIALKLGEDSLMSIQSQIGSYTGQSLQNQHLDILNMLENHSEGLNKAKEFIATEESEQERLKKMLQADEVEHLEHIDNLNYFEKDYMEKSELCIRQAQEIARLNVELTRLKHRNQDPKRNRIITPGQSNTIKR